MTRTENSRSLNQRLLCAAAPGREMRGGKREKRGNEKSGREKKESESGDFFLLPVLCVSRLTILYLYSLVIILYYFSI